MRLGLRLQGLRCDWLQDGLRHWLGLHLGLHAWDRYLRDHWSAWWGLAWLHHWLRVCLDDRCLLLF